MLAVLAIAAGYSIGVVKWARGQWRSRHELTTASVVLVGTLLPQLLWNWSELSFALGDRTRIYPNPMDVALIRFVEDFPGGGEGLTVALAALQIVLTVSALQVLGHSRVVAGTQP